MGNRCLIVPVNTETGVYSDLGIYLHWYGPVSYTHLTLPTNREV